MHLAGAGVHDGKTLEHGHQRQHLPKDNSGVAASGSSPGTSAMPMSGQVTCALATAPD